MDACDAFSPAGGPAPAEAVYVSHDEFHLSEKGAHELAHLFLDTGYAPLR